MSAPRLTAERLAALRQVVDWRPLDDDRASVRRSIFRDRAARLAEAAPELVAEVERLHALIERITPDVIDAVRDADPFCSEDEARLATAADILAALRGDA